MLMFIGMVVVSAVIGFGVYHLVTRVHLLSENPRHSRRMKHGGNDTVKNHTDE
jgi:uncharacterized protein (DUF2062 family)